MPDDPLYHSIIASTDMLTTVLSRLEATHRFALRLQAYALTLIGLALLGLGLLAWDHLAQAQDHAAQREALRLETRALAAQTDLLRQTLARPTP